MGRVHQSRRSIIQVGLLEDSRAEAWKWLRRAAEQGYMEEGMAMGRSRRVTRRQLDALRRAAVAAVDGDAINAVRMTIRT